MKSKYGLRAINETGDKTIDVQLIQVPDSAITAGSGTVSIATATGDVTGPSSATNNNIAVFDQTTGKLLKDGAATIASLIPATSLLRSYLATTVTYNANAVLADTPLSVTVVAGGIYDISLVVHSTSAVKALNMDFGGTATVANFIGEWIGYEDPIDIDGGPTRMRGIRITAQGTDFSVPSVDGLNSFYTFTGSVEITDAGTFLLRGAQNVSDASNTTILRGSTLTLTKMN